MKKLIDALKGSGIGTLAGIYRLSPNTSDHVFGAFHNPKDYPDDLSLDSIPEWFHCSLSDGFNNHLGTIGPELKPLKAFGRILDIKAFCVFFLVESDKKQSVHRIAISFKRQGSIDKVDPEEDLSIFFEYDEQSDDGNDLGMKMEYPLEFRATVSPGLWWCDLMKEE